MKPSASQTGFLKGFRQKMCMPLSGAPPGSHCTRGRGKPRSPASTWGLTTGGSRGVGRGQSAGQGASGADIARGRAAQQRLPRGDEVLSLALREEGDWLVVAEEGRQVKQGRRCSQTVSSSLLAVCQGQLVRSCGCPAGSLHPVKGSGAGGSCPPGSPKSSSTLCGSKPLYA